MDVQGSSKQWDHREHWQKGFIRLCALERVALLTQPLAPAQRGWGLASVHESDLHAPCEHGKAGKQEKLGMCVDLLCWQRSHLVFQISKAPNLGCFI